MLTGELGQLVGDCIPSAFNEQHERSLRANWYRPNDPNSVSHSKNSNLAAAKRGAYWNSESPRKIVLVRCHARSPTDLHKTGSERSSYLTQVYRSRRRQALLTMRVWLERGAVKEKRR